MSEEKSWNENKNFEWTNIGLAHELHEFARINQKLLLGIFCLAFSLTVPFLYLQHP